MGGGHGEPEQLLLIKRPRADGRVEVRRWTSEDWSAPPEAREYGASDLLSEIERAVRQRRGLNHELTVVRQWLQSGGPPRVR